MAHKIGLGTAQFGSHYGISNKKGKIENKESSQILRFAAWRNVDMLDTATAYGDSEAMIGEFMCKSGISFKVVSKFSRTDDENACLTEKFNESLSRLGLKRLYGYLIHKFADFEQDPDILDELKHLKKKKLVEKIGFSLYSPDELNLLLKTKKEFDIVQLPYSVFDQRFESGLRKLKNRGVEVHARSVFLQGLAFMNPRELPHYLREAQQGLEELRRISGMHATSIGSLCLNFVIANRLIDKVIVGVDSLRQLNENLLSIRPLKAMKQIMPELKSLKIEDEDTVLPHRWSKV